MRVSIEISPSNLKKIIASTKEDNIELAVNKALEDYIRIQTLSDFSKAIHNNEFDLLFDNKEIEELDK